MILSFLTSRRVLTRLGETHTSSCHPDRESRFPVVTRPHPQGYVSLKVAHINLNPFLSAEERAVVDSKKAYTLISNSRYFVHQTSYIRTSDEK